MQRLSESCGGIDGYIFNIAKHIGRTEKVVIIDRKYRSDDPPVEHLDNINIIRLDAPQFTGRLFSVIKEKFPAFTAQILNRVQTFLFALQVSRYLRVDSFDIVHVNTTLTGIVLAYSRVKTKIVYTCHHPYWVMIQGRLDLLHAVLLLLDCLLIRRADAVIALNPRCHERFVKTCHVARDKVPVIPSGVDTNAFAPNSEYRKMMRAKLGLTKHFVILYVGSMKKIKGVVQLAKAIGILVNDRNIRNIVLLLVGSDPERGSFGVDRSTYGAIKEIIRAYKLRKHILILGSMPFDDLRYIYNAADLFVLPSLAECCPSVILEAMASGTPVLATRIAGDALIKDCWNGRLIAHASETLIAKGIFSLLQTKNEVLRMMRQNARCFVIINHNWRQIAGLLLHVYAAVLGNR
jgi:glycosyltransferase involved in cell wall biosynthesis